MALFLFKLFSMCVEIFFFFAVVFNHVKRCHHFMTNVPLGMVHALTFDFFSDHQKWILHMSRSFQ